MKLKQVLEKQRVDEALENREFKQKLAEEEQRLKEIQDKLDAQNKLNEQKRASLLENMKKKQSEQQSEIQIMLDEKRKKDAYENDLRQSLDNAKHMKDRAEIEKRLAEERCANDLEKSGTELRDVSRGIGMDGDASKTSMTGPISQLMDKKESMSVITTTELSPQHRS